MESGESLKIPRQSFAGGFSLSGFHQTEPKKEAPIRKTARPKKSLWKKPLNRETTHRGNGYYHKKQS